MSISILTFVAFSVHRSRRAGGPVGSISAAATDLGRAGPGGSSRMPLHTVIPMAGGDRVLDGGEDTDAGRETFECLVAAAGAGVWGLPCGGSGAGGGEGTSEGLLGGPMLTVSLPQARGVTCESLAVDHMSGSIAVSWRPPQQQLQQPFISPYHNILQSVRERAEGAVLDSSSTQGRHPLSNLYVVSSLVHGSSIIGRHLPGNAIRSGHFEFQDVQQLSGHSTGLGMTRGSFVPPPQHVRNSAVATSSTGVKYNRLYLLR